MIYDVMELDVEKIQLKDQINITIEECSELIQALTKFNRDIGDYFNIQEEIADLMLCIDRLIRKMNLEPEIIFYIMEQKFQRQKEREG